LKSLDEWSQYNLYPTYQKAPRKEKDLVEDLNEDHFRHNFSKHQIALYEISHQQKW
jgi:hypothetical protein